VGEQEREHPAKLIPSDRSTAASGTFPTPQQGVYTEPARPGLFLFSLLEHIVLRATRAFEPELV
jgi:hypothetical protein